tara:strand:+ start:398 stop:733 length:336 start_codon:yes stop_codon:yes gene_type:complete
MIRLSHFLTVPFITIFSLASSPIYSDNNTAETITQAEQDLKSAAQFGAVWRLVDKATGPGAIGIDKLLKLAKKKLDEGQDNEAKRLATRVSWAAQLGINQANEQKQAKPFY